MASTKKVARKKVSRKKTVKKATVSSSRAKKTTKKTVPKTTRGTSKGTDRTREERTSFDDKLAAVELLHRKKKKEKPSPTKKSMLPSKQRLRKPALRGKLSLALFTPILFPANIDALAIQTARISGIAFVVLGGLFALNFSQFIFSDGAVLTQDAHTMTAQLACDSLTMSALEYESCMASAGLAYNSNTAGETLSGESGTAGEALGLPPDPSILSIDNTEPAADFSFGATSPVQGDLPITVSVNGASHVKIRIYENWNTLTDEFDAVLANGDDWKYTWDTTRYADGEYFVRALIFNQYETSGYTQDHPSAFEVHNTDAVVEPEVAPESTPSAEVRLLTTSPIDQEAKLQVEVPDASEVRFLTKDSNGSINYLSSKADETTTGSGVWLYTWDTSGYVSDTYKVTARVKNVHSGNTYNAGVVTVKVEHPVADEPEPEDKPVETEVVDPEPEEEVPTEVPEATLSFRDGTTLSDFIEMYVDTPNAQSVRVYAIPEGSMTHKYIGTAAKIGPQANRWILRYYTRPLPNGEYKMYPEITNTFGTYAGEGVSVTVDNATPFTYDPQKKDVITAASAEVATIEQEVLSKAEVKSATSSSQEQDTATSSDGVQEDTERKQADAIIANFKESIDKELQRFASAYRSKDAERIALANERIDRLEAEIEVQAATEQDPEALIAEINKRIDAIVKHYTTAIQEADVLIAQRVKEDVFADSDKDGISDYDEVRIYHTNPLVADSDGDGFIDGAEIESGYNPTNPKREAAIAYESPKETGVVRADVLKVKTIVPVVDEAVSQNQDEVKVEAVITGVALPNSYVTIYIYSTPVVVTVKTDEDGAWRYRFDKELPDGEHNVYVGVTDNAGKIVAKSKPFVFIKQAQAFSPVDAAVSGSAQIVDPEQGMAPLSQYMLLLVISISVVSIGLVLILLGLHLDTRTKRYPEVVSTEP